MINLIGVGTLLILCTYSDLRKREISLCVLFLYGIGGIILLLLKSQLTMQRIPAALLPGVLFLILSKLTKEGIGYGDGLLLMVTGIYLGLEQNMEMLFTGLFAAALFSLFCVLIGKGNRKSKIPFVPFLTIGFFLSVLV